MDNSFLKRKKLTELNSKLNPHLECCMCVCTHGLTICSTPMLQFWYEMVWEGQHCRIVDWFPICNAGIPLSIDSSPSALLAVYFPANELWKVVEDGPSAWVLVAGEADPGRVSGSWFQPVQFQLLRSFGKWTDNGISLSFTLSCSPLLYNSVFQMNK